MQPLNTMGEGPQGPSADVASDSSRLSDDQWTRLKGIFHEALELPDAGRKAFIREACEGDEALEAALESLLASDDCAREFLETPAVARVGWPVHPTATLAPGDRLGAYEIVALLGAGGMGEVYRARDARLERDVALKVLPAPVMNDTVRRQWLMREAQAAAALDHPNICPIFDIGEQDGRVWIAMQFVEGETLAERLRRDPLELSLALDLATQMASALSAAHARGIVHRDIKPENVMVTATGHARVLDFGLAKIAAEHGMDTHHSGQSGVHSRRLGTLPYMSPEQLRSESLDPRTDVFSLSVVLYEMVTGRRPFVGDGDEELRTCILSVTPLPVTSLVAAVDPALNRITQKGLQKDRAARYQTMCDLAADLEDLKRRLEIRSQRIGTRMWVTRGALAAIVVGLIASLSSRQQTTGNSTGPLQYVQLTNFPDSVHSPALSRDGKMLAFVRGREPFEFPVGELYIKAPPDGQPVALTHDGTMKMAPAFDPDGSRIVFTSNNWSSWTIPVAGGSPTLFRPNAASLRWTNPGELLFSAIKKQPNMGIVAVSESRGTTRDVYVPPSGGMAHFSERSPDGKWVLVVEMDINGWLPCRLVPFDGSSSGRQVGPPAGACTSAAWSPDGQWMYFIATVGGESHLWRQPAADGSPQQLTFGPNEERGVAVDPDGLSVITSVGATQSTVWYHDASGDRSVSVEGYAYRPSLSSDGRKVFYLIRRGANRSWSLGELWATELATGRTERILPDFLVRSYHVSPDGKFVAFDAFDGKDLSRVWVAVIDGSQPPRRLTPDGGVEEQRPFFGASNNIYFMQQQAEAKASLYRARPDGSGRQKLSDDEFGFLVNISPDEKWAAVWNMGGERGGTWLVPLARGAAYRLCICGMGPIFQSSPMVSWSGNNETIFVNAGNQGGERAYPARGTVAIPWRGADTVPAGARLVPSDLERLRGALRIPEASVAPGRSTETYAFARQSEQRNLYRIRLP